MALINWNDVIDVNDSNRSFDNLLSGINSLVDKYMPFKKISNREFKRMYKPWITDGILNSIKRRDKLYNKYVKSKNNIFKVNLHEEYKVLRNQMNGLSKKTILQNLSWNIPIILKRY